jgi:hypothetical protein
LVSGFAPVNGDVIIPKPCRRERANIVAAMVGSFIHIWGGKIYRKQPVI